MSFHETSTWWLMMLLVLPVLWWRWRSPGRRNAVSFSSITAARSAGRGWIVRLRWIIPALRTLAIVLLIVGLARPRKADQHTRVFAEGIAIELVVDRSGSMKAEDFQKDGKPANRLTAVRDVVEAFVLGKDDLKGRPDDLVGLIAFARYADSRCPLTLDQAHLVESIRQTDFVNDRSEDGTAIGDAIALGVERLHSLDLRNDVRGRSAVKSRVMILLTDGENNRGDIDPLTAAQMAAAFDIKIYTIGAGTNNPRAPMPSVDLFGRPKMQMVPVAIDEKTLREISAITGGQYFRATDTDSLKNIYARIDELERTKIEQRRFTDYKEWSVEPLQFGRISVPPLLALVMGILVLEALLFNTRFSPLP